MRLGVPFIAPRQLGAVESKSGRPILPSVVGRTGQSGAHRTLFGARFLSLTGTVDRCRSGSRWRTGQSGAHRTVRCPLPTVGSATCPAQIARPTVGPADRWLTGQSGAPPDSPVNYSRTPLIFSRERPFHRRPAWHTGHCPVHHRTVRCTCPVRRRKLQNCFPTAS